MAKSILTNGAKCVPFSDTTFIYLTPLNCHLYHQRIFPYFSIFFLFCAIGFSILACLLPSVPWLKNRPLFFFPSHHHCLEVVEMAESGVTLTSPDRLHKIDQLRENNVGTHMPLPQLVVVGDQSSGKSSLLESLTGIPFPNGQGLCTRYATQITHRRDAVEEVVVSIIPGPDATDQEKQGLASYRRTVQSTAELQNQFESILSEVRGSLSLFKPRAR